MQMSDLHDRVFFLNNNIKNVFWIPTQVSCQLVGNADKIEFLNL